MSFKRLSSALLCAAASGLAGCGVATGGLKADGGGGGFDAAVAIDGALAFGPWAGHGPAATSSVDAGQAPGVFAGSAVCLGLGSACSQPGECCSADCTGGACRYPACTSDHGTCASDGECCGRSCVAGVCASLNPSCKTMGNACALGADCCSRLCAGGTCQASSFCGQPGDACSAGADCCTGSCSGSGSSLGTCAPAAPAGPANCGLVDGQICGGLGGGVAASGDGGVPTCGGPCCSRACAPWGPTGVLVCQPASGCHVVGDLCTQDSDCCGAAGLPGGSHKPVTCVISGPGTVGVCRNPMGCKPDGDVCKLKTMSCNASCDCCSGNCETQDTCRQDNVGVPRCAPASCVAAGSACASSASCCGGAPCVPNPAPGATPPYVCGGSACVAACGGCTTSADCCPGVTCVSAPGSTHGTCGPCAAAPDGGGGAPGPNPGVDAGPNRGALTDGGACSVYGQLCAKGSDCCNGVPCTNGKCISAIF